jgi:hypothetical protein
VKPNRLAWILPVAAAVTLTAFAALNHGRAARQSIALADARRQNLELHSLENERRHLESAQLSTDDLKELEAAHAEADALWARLAALQREAAQRKQADAEPSRLSAKDWVYAGSVTPRAAIESVLWAASRGDVDHLANLIGFSPGVREQADAMFSRLPTASQQEYGSPEKVVATLLAGSFPKDASAVTILVDNQWDQDAALAMSVEHSNGHERTNQFTFHHAPDGWQLMVPASVMAGYDKILQGDTQPTESGAP